MRHSGSQPLPDGQPPERGDAAAPGHRIPDEGELVARIRGGDGAAFKQVFLAYYEPLWAFMLTYVKVPEIAEECVQDVFGWVWEHRGELTIRSGVQRYLFGAARNRALDYLRRRHVADRWAAGAVSDSAAGVRPRLELADERARTRDLEAAVERAVTRLPERRQQVFRLRVQHHFTNAETATLMGISVKGVEFAFTAGLKALREELRDFF
jgi:RNA polymerase sigma-70 factor, ECF subfamily